MALENIEEIAEAAAKKAVEEIFIKFGLDVSDPLTVQGDFMRMREVGSMLNSEEFRRDMIHVRTWRLTMEDIKAKSLLTVVGFMFTGLLALILLGFKNWVSR